jgi:hypothetical protein
MKFIFGLFVLITSNCLGGIVISGDTSHSKFSGRAYVISIGVDKYANPKYNPLRYCQSDADYFLKSLDRDTSIKEIVKYVFRNNATREDLTIACNDIAMKATSKDLFIFYYAGMSSGEALLLTNGEMKYREVFILSENIFSERQIFISDASDGNRFGEEFKLFLKEKPLERLSTKIDRVLISLKSSSYELPTGSNLRDLSFAGGQLTGALANCTFPLTNIFNSLVHSDKFWTQFKMDLYETYNSAEHPFSDIFIFSERDYLSEVKSETNRAEMISLDEPSLPEKIIINKGETFTIVLGNQNFSHLTRLPNVMNDVEDVGKILMQKYNTKTVFLADITYDAFRDTMDRIMEKYTFEQGSQVLFFCASHGFKDKFGEGYLCFTDTRVKDRIDNAHSLQHLKRKITGFGATNTLMLMDICYSSLAFDENNCVNPDAMVFPLNSPIFTSPFNSKSPAYKNFLNQESNLYFGSSRDQEASDGAGRNSPFAKTVISFLSENNLPVIDSRHLQNSLLERLPNEGAISLPLFCSYNCDRSDGRFLFIRK